MPKTFASQPDPDESGRKGALCRGTIVYEVDDSAQIAPYKLKILARFGHIPISQLSGRSITARRRGRRHARQACRSPVAAHPRKTTTCPPSGRSRRSCRQSQDAPSLTARNPPMLSPFTARNPPMHRSSCRTDRAPSRKQPHVRERPPRKQPHVRERPVGRRGLVRWARRWSHSRRRRNPRSQKGTGVSAQIPSRGGYRCYLAFSRISTRRHRLVAESGRVSARRTRSPMPALFSSS